jgi:hypothetical protein
MWYRRPTISEVFLTGQRLVDGRVLARQPDVRAHLLLLAGDVVAADRRRAAVRAQQRGEDAHGRRLAGAVGAEQGEDAGGGHLEVDAAQGFHVPEALLEVAGDDCGIGHTP